MVSVIIYVPSHRMLGFKLSDTGTPQGRRTDRTDKGDELACAVTTDQPRARGEPGGERGQIARHKRAVNRGKGMALFS